jgi:hypothetical protein
MIGEWGAVEILLPVALKLLRIVVGPRALFSHIGAPAPSQKYTNLEKKIRIACGFIPPHDGRATDLLHMELPLLGPWTSPVRTGADTQRI